MTTTKKQRPMCLTKYHQSYCVNSCRERYGQQDSFHNAYRLRFTPQQHVWLHCYLYAANADKVVMEMCTVFELGKFCRPSAVKACYRLSVNNCRTPRLVFIVSVLQQPHALSHSFKIRCYTTSMNCH